MADFCRNPKRYIPLVSLLLWHKTVACASSSLRLWSSEAWQADENTIFFVIVYPAACTCFLVLMLYLRLNRVRLFRKGDFHPVWQAYGISTMALDAAFLSACITLGGTLLNTTTVLFDIMNS